VILTVHGGELWVPQREASPLDAELPAFGEPETGTAPASETIMRSPTGRSVRRNLATGESELEFRWQDSRTRLVDSATEMGERNVATYRIVEGDPLSATVICEVETTLSRPGVLNTRTVATTVMTCDRECFTVISSLDAFEDDVRVHARTYTHHFDRDGV
jgi:hypothetical protein